MSKVTIITAQILTYAGLLPFLLLSAAVAMNIKGHDYDLALRAYGTVIISFLCGIHRAAGLLFSDKCPRHLLVHSNVITLAAYGSIFLGLHGFGFVIQSFCLVFLLKLDDELMKQQIIPVWYFSLRRNATLAVVVLLMSAAYLS